MFIKETKILKKKEDLKYIVPTEINLNVANYESNKAQEFEKRTVENQDWETAVVTNKSDETLQPQEVTPSSVSYYDGTAIPLEIEEATPPQPSYSTQTIQEKSEDEVKLNLYPNLLSSTLSVLSDMLSGSEVKIPDDDSVNVASSEIIDKLDESDNSSKEKQSLPVTAENIIDQDEAKQVFEPNLSESESKESFDLSSKEKEETENMDFANENDKQNLSQEETIDLDMLTQNVAEKLDSIDLDESNNDTVSAEIESHESEILNVEKLENIAEDNITVPKVNEEEVLAHQSRNSEEYFIKTEDNVTTNVNAKVPLKEEEEVEETTPSNNESFFIASESSLDSSIISSNSTDDDVNLATETSTVVDQQNSAKIPINLQNDSGLNRVDSVTQLTDSSQETIVDIPSTSSFSQFLGDRNLLNAAEGSEDVSVDKIMTGESLSIKVSHGNDENLSVESQQEIESVTSSPNYIEKVVLSDGTCEKGIECIVEVSHKLFSSSLKIIALFDI